MNYYEEIFKKRLQEGAIYEKKASELICELNGVSLIKFNNDYRYDFKTSDGLKYEVKADKVALKTKNFFIEFEGYGKPSGIQTTKANFYILTNTKEYFKIDVNKLKILCEQHGYTGKVNISKTYGHLLTHDIIKNNSLLLL
jgi:hypothetical protein